MKDFKKEIIECIGTGYKPTDEPLVDELIFNFAMLDEAKTSILKDGIILNTVKDPKKQAYYQRSPAVGVYDTCLKNIQNLYAKLNIAPVDRARLAKMVEEVEDDDFGKEFD